MLTLRYNEPVFILMLRGRVGCLRQPTLPLSIRINRGSLYRNVSILNYKRGLNVWSSLNKCANFKLVLLFLYLYKSIMNGFYNIIVYIVRTFSRCDIKKYFVWGHDLGHTFYNNLYGWSWIIFFLQCPTHTPWCWLLCTAKTSSCTRFAVIKVVYGQITS